MAGVPKKLVGVRSPRRVKFNDMKSQVKSPRTKNLGKAQSQTAKRGGRAESPGVRSPRMVKSPGVRSPRKVKSPGVRSPRRANSPGVRSPRRANSPGVRSPRRANSPGVRSPRKVKSPEVKSPRRMKSPGVRSPRRVKSPGMKSPRRMKSPGLRSPRSPRISPEDRWKLHDSYNKGVSCGRIVTRSQTSFNRIEQSEANLNMFSDEERHVIPGQPHLMQVMSGEYGSIPRTLITRTTGQKLKRDPWLIERLLPFKVFLAFRQTPKPAADEHRVSSGFIDSLFKTLGFSS